MSNPSKNRKWFIIGGIVLVLIIIGAIVGEDDKTKPETLADPTSPIESSKTPKPTTEVSKPSSLQADKRQEAKPATAEEVLDVDVSRLKQALSSSGFEWKIGTPIDGATNHVGQSGRNVAQIIEGENGIRQAAMTAVFDADVLEGTVALVAFEKYFNAITPTAWKNLDRDIMQENWKKDWKETELVGDVRFEMVYVKMDQMGTLAITATPR